jgi:hypothetical protein
MYDESRTVRSREHRIFAAAHREAAKREARALHPCRPFDEERGGALQRNRFEICLLKF